MTSIVFIDNFHPLTYNIKTRKRLLLAVNSEPRDKTIYEGANIIYLRDFVCGTHNNNKQDWRHPPTFSHFITILQNQKKKKETGVNSLVRVSSSFC